MKTRSKYGEPLRWLKSHATTSETDCLHWPFGKTVKGYGSVRMGGVTMHAHRAMCLLAHGEAPPNTEVAHSCGVRDCVNPNHLRHATSKENSSDTALHGRNLAGDKHPRAKLTSAQVEDIRARVGAGLITQAEAARHYAVTDAAISLIVRRINWPETS